MRNSTKVHRRSAALPRARWYAFLGAGLLHGVFLFLCFPPVGLWPIALVAIVPLIWAGCRTGVGIKSAALLTALGTLPGWLLQHVWLWNITQPGYPAMGIYMAAYSAIFVWMIAQARSADWRIPMTVVAALGWAAIEVIRGELVLTGYGFYLLGHPLIESTLLAGPASLLGAYAVSMLCAAISGAVADAAGWSGIRRPIGGIGAAIVGVIWLGLGLLGLASNKSSGPTFEASVGVVQTNLPQDNKIGWSVAAKQRDMKRFVELTTQVGTQRPAPELILWPETMFPGPALNGEAIKQIEDAGFHWTIPDSAGAKSKLPLNSFARELFEAQRTLGIPMMVGAIAMDGDVAGGLEGRPDARFSRYNCVISIIDGAPKARYDKVDLTPFGEMIPYVHRWPDLQQMVLNLGARGMSFDLAAGTSFQPLTVVTRRDGAERGGLLVATPICFEVTRASLCRNLSRQGPENVHPNLLINFSNDGWFGWWDPGRQVHLLSARWRCVELGLPMVRAVNTGISAAIDRRGRVLPNAGPMRQDRALVFTVSVESTRSRSGTLFWKLGQIPMYVVAGLGIALAGATWHRRRRIESGLL
ncbi:MAG: apolipoprotein N-acyltransferase [Phycisphaerales bacterium]|nr:apolipoprotein N-acyltransferase [Phycisphaerales bacterium]